MSLTPRARRILLALISEHLSSGEPVSSGTLGRLGEIGLSSASIRAVFAELEHAGFLSKPHSSSGRVPTEKGLRTFVDALLTSGELPAEKCQEIEQRLAAAGDTPEAVLRLTGRILAELTGSAAVVVSQPGASLVLKELRFLAVRPDAVLAVIVGSGGSVQNRLVRTERTLSPVDLERANNLLAALVENRTLQQVRHVLSQQLEGERARHDVQLRAALALGERALAQAQSDAEVVVEGHARLINRPEFADIDRARQALRTLEDHELLVQLLDRTMVAPGIQVLIGAEESGDEMRDLSLVGASFGPGGMLGVLGSTRMDYSMVVPTVRVTASVLARMLREPGDT